jgi:glycosyltransferase involved in cell wall biosynthesis
VTWLLRLAEKLVNQIVTASPESFRLPSPKVVVTGHGIDTDMFAPTPTPHASDQPFTITSIGRIAPIKRLETLIEAIHILVHEHGLRDFQARIIGHTYPHDMTYAKGLHQQIADTRLNGYVRFLDAVSFSQVATEHQRADVVVNLSDTDSVDKTIVEAMSCGVPVVTSNLAARSVLHEFAESLMVAKGDSTQLASCIWELSRQTPMERQATGLRLRRIAVEEHSLQKLASRLVHDIL